VKQLFPNSIVSTIEGDMNLLEILRERESWHETEKTAALKKEEYENKLKAYMKNNEKLSFSDGSYCTWKQAKDTKYFNKDLLRKRDPDIYDEYIEFRPGSRRFFTKLK
jgi:hypothetical protein